MSKYTLFIFLVINFFSKPVHAVTPPFELDFDQLKQEVAVLECIVEPHYNKVVQSYLNRYLKTGRSYSARMIGRTDIYFPIFEAYLEAEGLPEDLKYLPIVESALNPKGTSRVGAQGLWQFMPNTAPEFGMQVSIDVDERMDTNLATKGALSYLKKSYERFQSWELALAAYNAGPGRVNRAIKRSRSKKFSRVKRYLPRETQNYIPAFIAATFLMKNYEKYELIPHTQDLDLVLTETVVVNQQINFELIKRITGIDRATLKRLNPSYINELVPFKKGGSLLILPSRAAQAMYDYQELYAYQGQRPTIDHTDIKFVRSERIPSEHYIKTVFKLKEELTTGALSEIVGVSKHILLSWNPRFNQRDTLESGIQFVTFKPSKYTRYNSEMRTVVPKIPGRNPLPIKSIEKENRRQQKLGIFLVGKNNSLLFKPSRTIRLKTLLSNYKEWNKSFILRKNKLKPEDLVHPSDAIRIQ